MLDKVVLLIAILVVDSSYLNGREYEVIIDKFITYMSNYSNGGSDTFTLPY